MEICEYKRAKKKKEKKFELKIYENRGPSFSPWKTSHITETSKFYYICFFTESAVFTLIEEGHTLQSTVTHFPFSLS